ncbi:MAG: double-strand break repair helicase AddA [Paracoccaceae bacterium]
MTAAETGAPTPERPTDAQRRAANPQISAWVTANAGSGKTRVLTQRVARLLLAGARPDRILCLTYTKAAAAEMQDRLFKLLGGWSMLPDGALGAHLSALEGTDTADFGREHLARARRLFAEALEAPGGLKIQTIHAFCDGLLRRFPVEAGISPGFEVMDERQAADLLGRIRAKLATDAETGHEPAFDRIAGRLNEGQMDGLFAAVLSRREAFRRAEPETDLAALFGEAARLDQGAADAARAARLNRETLRQLAATFAEKGGKDERQAAPRILAGLDGEATDLADALEKAFLTAKGEPRAGTKFPTKAVKQAMSTAEELAELLKTWAAERRADRLARAAARRSADLHAFAKAFLAAYDAEKARRGLLDFDDLVILTRRLLEDPAVGPWVLWKLDAGIEHVLVDEAQDTSPAQWALIRALTEAFPTADRARSIFVVGDDKQSIYSFQGADPAVFEGTRLGFRDRLAGGGGLEMPDLLVSFRSAPGILAFVDQALKVAPAIAETVTHIAHRKEDAARIDLWPPAEATERTEADWWLPVDRAPATSAKAVLAERLAAEIARMIREDRLPARKGRPGRPVGPGDILVLVRSRDAFSRGLIRALKGNGVPVAGADRLSLGAELAVRDLLALAKVALMPSDDLSLAALLRSPLCDVSEETLFALAHAREGRLWQALMGSGETRAIEMLGDLAARADFLRPYEFLSRALLRYDGGRRLVARLGPEAGELIDELLAEALRYETRAIPTLAGFVDWIERGGIEIKREMEKGAGEVRVMTVHGAKGLEAPVVILPDTMKEAQLGRSGPVILPAESGLPLWLGSKEDDDPVSRAVREAEAKRGTDEADRLLYVALTRAEDWLILAGAATKQDPPETAWYRRLDRAMAAVGGIERTAPWGGPILRFEPKPCTSSGKDAPSTGDWRIGSEDAALPRPAWLAPAPKEIRTLRPAPSRLGADLAEVARLSEAVDRREASPKIARSAGAARAHGDAVHLLLERLPGTEPAGRGARAARLLQSSPLDAAARAAAFAEASAVLEAPFAAEIFGTASLGEVSIAVEIDGVRGVGRIDRLVVGRARVLVVDHKTDVQPPDRPQDVSPAYLAQIAAYLEAIRAIYPDREAAAAFLWTAVPRLMVVPDPSGGV